MSFSLFKNKGPVPSTESVGLRPRRREDARDWQVKLSADATFAANFHKPTQNEILETLHTLDHLTPHWDQATPEIIELRFMNEMALSYPSLRKTECYFPVIIAEDQTELSAGKTDADFEALRLQTAQARDRFRQIRAQMNALQQLAAGPTTTAPISLPPGTLPFRATRTHVRQENSRLQGLAGFAVLIACGVLVYFLYSTIHTPASPPQDAAPNNTLEEPTPVPNSTPVTAVPSSIVSVATSTVASSENSPSQTATAEMSTPSPAPVPMTTMEPTPPSPTPGTRSVDQFAVRKALLDQQLAASKSRALEKHPDLAEAGSEINTRFVFRYKRLVEENSARLQEPTWPEQLADECAKAAAGSTSKSKSSSHALATSHP